VRVAIVNGNAQLCENLKYVLGGETGITIVGAFGSGAEALGELSRASPEVALLDPELPDITGDEFIRRAKAVMPKLEVLIYSLSEDWNSVLSLLKAGATGYLLKTTKPKDLIEALHELHEGGAPLSPRVARMVITEFHEYAGAGREYLTARQTEILSGMDKGLTYRELAEKYLISPYTVRTHIRNIYEKLGAKCKAEAIRKAKKEGIL
jgi:DNA-binding NarL/FixJ family response regulator